MFLPLSFNQTVAALVESILHETCPETKAVPAGSCKEVARFLQDQCRRMPDYMRLSFAILTLVFDAWSLPFTGRGFHRLSPEQRARQIRAWKTSSPGLRRDFIKFYESFVFFAWYSEAKTSDNRNGHQYRHTPHRSIAG